jgi:glucosylceramidase
MGFTAPQQRDFIHKDLGPVLEAAGYGPNKLKLMIIDDQRSFINQWANVILKDNETAKYISGIAFHWYLNSVSSPLELDKTHNQFPDYFLLSTEACEGSSPFQKDKVSLGDWGRAESYAYDILTVMALIKLLKYILKY